MKSPGKKSCNKIARHLYMFSSLKKRIYWNFVRATKTLESTDADKHWTQGLSNIIQPQG